MVRRSGMRHLEYKVYFVGNIDLLRVECGLVNGRKVGQWPMIEYTTWKNCLITSSQLCTVVRKQVEYSIIGQTPKR